jgi:predicted Rossmann fold nucleotide-binding protein DprA/Smf involved in DNA uptake
MNDSSRAVLALTNRLVDTGVAPLRAAELWRLLAAVGDPATLVGRSAGQLRADLAAAGADQFAGADEAARLATLLDAGIALAMRLDALDERGIWTSTPFDPTYPPVLRARLGDAAPAVLYGSGDAALLIPPGLGVGVVGAHDVDDAGAEVARAAGRSVADAGLVVVSGRARGVDQLAMDAALAAGGRALGVLADPLEPLLALAAVRAPVLAGRLALISPYGPAAPASRPRSQGRNKIIFALSRVALVVATHDEAAAVDSTWTGAAEAIERRYGTVAVWRGAGEGPGNAALAAAGAVPVDDLATLARLPDGT